MLQQTNEQIIETTNLTKYYGTSRGIEDINLSINKGEVFGFIGPNGAGKSTTIRTLLGLLFPSSGSGKIFGYDIVKETLKIKGLVGFMPSEVNYYSNMNSRQLLEYSAGYYHLTDTEKRIHTLSDLFKIDLEKKIADLSLGNRKKLSIVQSLLHSPQLLILDEPTSGLDPLMQKRFFDLLKEENNKGVTVFLSSHTLSEVQKVCGRVAIIKNGRIIKIEDMKTLRRKHLKRVHLLLGEPVKEKEFSFEGVVHPEINDRAVDFLYSGEPVALLQFLVNKKVENITIEEPELEEIFMHYYMDT